MCSKLILIFSKGGDILFIINNKTLRILLPVVFTITILLSYGLMLPLKVAGAADNPVLSGGGLKTAPVLAADTTQNVVRKPVELTFTDDAAWREAISEVSVDGVSLDSGKYSRDTAGKITIDKAVFQISGDCAIVIKAHGYKDASVTQQIGLFYITGDGVAGEVVFTRAQLEAMGQERVVFSATNDFPYDLIMAAEGVSLRTLLEQAGMKAEAQVIIFRGSDGYTGEFTVNELLHQKRYHFPDKTEVEPMIALKRAERSADFENMKERDTPVLCFGQRAQTEQTLLQSVKIIQSISVTTVPPGRWARPTARISEPGAEQKVATQGGVVKSGSKIFLEGDPKTKIYYTTDGTEPNLNSKIFNESGCGPLAGQHQPVLVQTDTTIKAKAVWGGKQDSEVVAYRFTVAGETADTTVGVSDGAPVLQPGKTFTDIQGNWAREDIELLAARGMISGKSETTYEPGSNITRAEFAALLVRALGLEQGVLEEGQFKDVAATAWYAGSVAVGTVKKIIEGYDGSLFKPDNRITREEMAAMLARAARVAGKEDELSGSEQEQQLAQFNDRPAISPWAVKDVAWAVKAGMFKGMPGGEFAPQTNADRAQSAALLKRFITYTGGPGD
jgi:predicted secreted protein